ncbi:MAG: chemotaxis protein CheW, partial [Nitrospinota bacterium]
NVDQDSPVGPENRRVTIKDRRGSSKSAMQIVVLSLEETYYGLIVEEVIDIEETVVKPLSSYLKKSKCYMGATILSDGRVSMILDPLGVANIANLKFTEIDQSISKSITPFETLRPEQETLLFKNDTPEQFAVNIQSISRIEKVDIADIEKTGEKEFIHYKGSSLRIARIHDFLPVSKPKQIECNFVFVLIPKYVSPLVGIVATEMLDIVPVDRLNRETLTGSGVLATSIIKNKRTLFIDIFTLAQAAEPQLFPDIYSPVLKGLRVLLTGKDDYYQIVVHRYLEEAGMKVTREESGVSALNRLEKHGPYDIILTDLEMHDLGAQELIRKVNSTFALSSIPVFILLRQISQKIVFQIEQTGADAYALKLDRDKVLQGIITLINPPSPKKSPGVDDVIQSHLNASGERTNEN